MFSQLVVPMAILLLLLVVPGYLFLSAFGLPWTWAFCTAPIVSMGLVGIVGEIYNVLHIPAVPLTVFGPLVAILVLANVAMRHAQQRNDAQKSKEIPFAHRVLPTISWWAPMLFVAVGLLVCNNVFMSELDSADAVLQHYDVTHHLNIIQAFFDARNISSLGINPYLAPEDAAIMPYGLSAVYPSGWYGICALLMHVTGVSAPIAINASMAVFMGVVLPLASLAWASMAFEGRRVMIVPVALTCVSFATFPYSMLIFGPLYPNLAGFVALPATSALFMFFVRALTHTEDGSTQGHGLRRAGLYAIPFVIASAGQALLHPNTLFSIFLIHIPYCAWCIYDYCVNTRNTGKRVALGTMAIFIAVCAIIWTGCFLSPAFDSIVGEFWPGFAYSWQEVVNILTQTYVLGFFNEIAAQVVLGILVIIGWVCCAYDKRTSWMAVSYVMVCFVNFVAAVVRNVTIKQFFAGFWYTDAMRLAAMACLLAALLAGRGFAWVYQNTCLVFTRYNDRLGRKTHRLLIACVLGFAFLVQNFMPGFNWPGAHKLISDAEFNEKVLDGREYDTQTVKTTFGDFRQLIRDAYNSNLPIDEQEREFLREMAQIVPAGALIINDPMDGSFLAYGGMGLRVYYREFGYAGGSTETPTSAVIRTKLCDIASDPEVRKAVDEIGAQYVLVMSEQNSSWSFINLRGDYSHSEFAGISGITSQTPGFTCLLTNGPCSLYKID